MFKKRIMEKPAPGVLIVNQETASIVLAVHLEKSAVNMIQIVILDMDVEAIIIVFILQQNQMENPALLIQTATQIIVIIMYAVHQEKPAADMTHTVPLARNAEQMIIVLQHIL
jgi:hypothetical protein